MRSLATTLGRNEMGLLLDWVPNHMGNAPGQNPWWDDVLENGRSSIHAQAFDIDWAPLKHELTDTILLPVLGEQYGRVLEDGQLRVEHVDGAFFVRYFEQRFPLNPRSLLELVRDTARGTGLDPLDPHQQELESIATSLRHLPNRRATADEDRLERAREKEVFKRRLKRLLGESSQVRIALENVVQRLNGKVGEPSSFDGLDKLLGQQCYRLASWRVAAQEINYRRFFDINSLVALRMEEPSVFKQAHQLLFSLIDDFVIQGLRLDHTDGLYDPLGYFEQLQQHFRGVVGHDPSRMPDDALRPLPLLIEKIRETSEKIPLNWPIDGTTGYEFANAAIGITIDPDAENALTRLYVEFTSDTKTFQDHVYDSKQRILADSLASELNMLARQLERIASSSRRWRDLTLVSLTRALTAVLIAFPVYRTYVRPGLPVTEEDHRIIALSVRLARMRSATFVDGSVFDFIQDILLQRNVPGDGDPSQREWFAMRFQQFTGPVMAKAVEDTAFYRYHRFLALNEVGGNPARFGLSTERFLAEYAERLRSWPLSMVTTSTHDTKRGEDAAAALAVLTEMPEEWRAAVKSLAEIARPHKTPAVDALLPTARDEYLYYQALVGAWPFGWNGEDLQECEVFVERMKGFMAKATKEAKQETAWTTPDPRYDEAVVQFVQNTLGDPRFRRVLSRLCSRIGTYAASNGLSKALLRLCSPGVPDTYQGAELWNQSLVDPDNRRPVDYELRRELLRDILEVEDRATLLARLLVDWPSGAIKLFVTHVALRTRREHSKLFLFGDFAPLPAGEHAVAFIRSFEAQTIIVCVPRLPLRLTRGSSPWPIGSVWGDQSIPVPQGCYRNAFSGELLRSSGTLRLSECFREFPVTLLVSHDASADTTVNG
ncbi:MAG: malto-oligosyltrehalose synthase [Polyangiaceae bacterium]